jgi:SnoaL-like domain
MTSAAGLDLNRGSTPIVVLVLVTRQPSEEERMTTQTTTAFDIDAFRRGYEEWDIESLLDLYADDLELVQVDRDNPPSAPRVLHGKQVLKGMLEHCAAAGVKASVENTVVDDHRAAATVTCEFPGGRKVLANGIFEIEDGRIVRERDVLSGDPRA